MALSRRTLATMFSLLSVAILAGGWVMHRADLARSRARRHEDLASVAALRVDQVKQWRAQRLADAVVTAKQRALRDAAGAMRRGQDRAAGAAARAALKAVVNAYGYADAALLSPEGRLLVAVNGTGEWLGTASKAAIQRAVTKGTAEMSSLIRMPGGVQVDVAAIVRDAAGGATAAVMLRMRAGNGLFPLMQRWPTPSRSAETLLIEQVGSDVVRLDALRSTSSFPDVETFTSTSSSSDLPIVRAVLRQQGAWDGTDQHRVPVLAELRAIPDSPWFIVVKLDEAEFLEGERSHALATLATTLLGIVLIGAGVSHAYRTRQEQLEQGLADAKRHDIAAQRALMASDERLRLALEAGNVGLYDIDLAGGCVTVSAEYASMLGHASDAFRETARTWVARLHPDDRIRVLRAYRDYVENRATTFDLEYRLRAADGQWRSVLSVARIVERDAAGAPSRMLGTHVDLTAHKASEAALIAANEAAESAAKAKSNFLAIMSHEIRTPMNGVLGMTSLLAETSLTDEQRVYVESSRRSAESLLVIINDILDFSKAEAGKLQVESIPFDLRVVIQDVADLLQVKAETQGIALVVRTPAGCPSRVVGDPGRIRQVLINLVGNAIKFTEQGEVRVDVGATTSSEGIRFRVDVTDTGIGIPDIQLASLFQPFTQADSSTTRRFGGTGLGLSICKRLVELMGGEIGARSVPGSGSTFWFTVCLPEAEAEAETVLARTPGSRDTTRHSLVQSGRLAATPSVAVAGGVSPAARDDAARRDVLIVEDNPVNQMVASRMLEKFGCRVTVTNDGVSGVTAAMARPFDLILMDLQMPRMDGLEATRQIRCSRRTQRRRADRGDDGKRNGRRPGDLPGGRDG